MEKYQQIITDCGKSPKMNCDGITKEELHTWCTLNGCIFKEIDDETVLISKLFQVK